MARANKVDKNQAEIVTALRAVGATVQPLNTVKSGCPDILVGYRGRNLLMEIKTPGGTMTDDEIRWHADWCGRVYIVKSAQEAVDLLDGEEFEL